MLSYHYVILRMLYCHDVILRMPSSQNVILRLLSGQNVNDVETSNPYLYIYIYIYEYKCTYKKLSLAFSRATELSGVPSPGLLGVLCQHLPDLRCKCIYHAVLC